MFHGTRALIFDIEGVVIDSDGAWDTAQEYLLRRYGYQYERAVLKPLLAGRSSEEAAEILISHHQLPCSIADFAAECRELVGQVMERRLRFMPGFPTFFHDADQEFSTAAANSPAPGTPRSR
ncbi:hypothetical protein ACFWIB_39220 [Streptomyces sp. NPDC127051]|uniref:hypothetical protein n=1 Tax=Streptomyces sp. NPDC127051 TaxID=3347119 RepID=UPI0036654592